MNCKQAKQNIALHAGSDLDAASARELRRHLKECPECAAHSQRMRTSIETLQRNCPCAGPIEDSVWPELVVRLPKQRTVHRRPDRFNGWAPALAVVAACGLMLMIARWNAPVGGNGVGRIGAAGQQPGNISASQFNAVFAPDSTPYEPRFSSRPNVAVDETSDYDDLISGALKELNSEPHRGGRSLNRPRRTPVSNPW